jgi:hypothetical protein
MSPNILRHWHSKVKEFQVCAPLFSFCLNFSGLGEKVNKCEFNLFPFISFEFYVALHHVFMFERTLTDDNQVWGSVDLLAGTSIMQAHQNPSSNTGLTSLIQVNNFQKVPFVHHLS